MKKTLLAVVIGDFANGENVYSGQTAKTRDYYHCLVNRFGDERISFVDTRPWKQRCVSVLTQVIEASRKSKSVVLLLCTNGLSVKLLLPLMVFLKRLLKFKLYFSVVGGSLLETYERLPGISSHLSRADAVYVETCALKHMLEERGHTNIYYAPVFSRRESITEVTDTEVRQVPSRFCTYSRVIREKGISDAIRAVLEVNRRAGFVKCVLDVYGEPSKEYATEFYTLLAQGHDQVFSHPLLTDSDAIETLSKHYCMLFPTFYDGEGFPIAIIECYKAGLPIVATDWHFNAELIDHMQTGYVYNRSEEELSSIVDYLICNPDLVLKMKANCLKKSAVFDPNRILEDLYSRIEEGLL